MSIQEAYREFRAGNFRVNRQYQRKLVWTREEKQALIDSILQGYPIPLILLAYTINDDGSKSFEILDGMQRLNAIFSFIENDFDILGEHFDVEQLSRAKQLAEDGEFEAVRDENALLDSEKCANFLDYTLAVTEFPASDENAVHEVFGRINSYGRQLSSQERRQAGIVSEFATIVRELAAEIRGDVSQDTLDLSQMPVISVDVDGEAPAYGVKADDTFWCKQGVLRRSQLRDSEDEQMIADLVITILEEEPFAFSGPNLDDCYDPASSRGAALETALATYGSTKLKSDLIGTLSILRETVEAVDSSSNALRRILHPTSGGNPIKTAFYAVFNAFFRLCVEQEMSPDDPNKIMGALQNLQSKLQVAAGQIRSEPRSQNINLTIGLIQGFFEDKEPPALMHGTGAALPLENALRRSKIETANYECKQGIVRLDADRQLDDELLSRIIETVCGIANVGPDSEGALFIGVADSEADKNRIEQLDGIPAAHVANRFIVGVERELAHLGTDLEGYKRLLVERISASDLSPQLKSDVLARIDCVVYRGFSVLCLWIPSQETNSTVGERTFIREGSSTKEVTGTSAITAVVDRFRD